LISVAHNMASLNAMRQFGKVTGAQKKSTEKLASGYKINRAADDAAGLTISEKMRSLIRGLNQGSDNIQDGISLMQIADGALAEVHSMLHRANELAIKSANGTNTDADREAIQAEVSQIAGEIDRIGSSTSFNTMLIFDKATIEAKVGTISKLVTSPAADTGHITESVQIGSSYYSAATMDFSKVNSSNIDSLNGAYFTFNCSQSCSEAFKISFKTDGSGSDDSWPSSSNLSMGTLHEYTIDISNCTSGTDIVNKVLTVVGGHAPTTSSGTPLMAGGIHVSHSNELAAVNGGDTLAVYENWHAYPTAASAESAYAKKGSSGAVDVSNLTQTYTPEPILDFPIQCSNVVDDNLTIHTRMMNAEYLGVDKLDLSTQEGAKAAIDKINKAVARISKDRSDYGAFQNRLESAYRNNENKAENTTAAESAIRDADMAKEMLEYTKNNILSQAGVSIMGQANQSSQNILSLFQ